VLDVAGSLISTDLAERRNLILVNPGEGHAFATARTMMAAYQMIMPGERARAHRHTPNALRLVLDAGPDTYTVVDGKKLPMLPGDVLLTPGWSWHSHANEGRSPAYWLDFLDSPLVEWLGSKVFEQHPDEFESGVTLSEYSPMRFAWSDTQHRLTQALAAAPGPRNIEVELGDPALHSMALFMMGLMPGISTACHKAMANNIYAVVHGNGVIEVEGEQFEWQRGDVFVVPVRHGHTILAMDNAVLLRVTDTPLMSA
jgi:gentisate 1,2-dioxygenase